MEDTFTSTTRQSYSSRLANSFKGILIGVLLLFCSVWLLVWNEGNTVAWHRSLDEGLKNTVNLPSADTVDPAYESRLVHLIGRAETKGDIQDSVFGVAANQDGGTKFLKLQRSVEMYQWQEKSSSSTRKNTGGSTTTETTVSYNKIWSEKVISSSGFKHPNGHENPNAMAYSTLTTTAVPINFGAFTLPEAVISLVSWFVDFPYDLSIENIPDEALREKAKTYGKGFYIGENTNVPAVGDLKVTFRVVTPQTISIIAQQLGSSFGKYYTQTGGKQILLVERGAQSSDIMFQNAQSATVLQAWFIRFGGFVLMYIGFSLLVKPLTVAADVLPFLGNILGGVTSCIIFVLTLMISAIVIALSWITYRPFLAGSCLLAIGGFVYWRMKSRLGKPVLAHAYVVSHTDDHELELQPTFKE